MTPGGHALHVPESTPAMHVKFHGPMIIHFLENGKKSKNKYQILPIFHHIIKIWFNKFKAKF